MKYDGDTVKEWAGDSQWRMLRADLARFRKHGYSGYGSEGFWALVVYRVQHAMMGKRPKVVWLLPRIVFGIIKKLLTMVTHINLNAGATIGPGLFIPHVGPIRVSQWTTIGADCAIHQVATLGAGAQPGGPTVGDHVYFGAHICVLGPVTIGDGAKIGAGAVVVTDIPAGATAVGVPAKAIMPKDEQVNGD